MPPTQKFFLKEDLDAGDLKILQSGKKVTIDTELTGLDPHRDLLCLVQICDPQGNVHLLRRNDWRSASFLNQLLADPTVQKIFHFALMDCSFLFAHCGVEVANPYCTKIASKLARTYSGEHGLSSLVKDLLEIEMDKTKQTSDWLRPDISSEQLVYASGDVIHLLTLQQKLEAILERKGMLPSGISYLELNARTQAFLPTLVHLWYNGWEVGGEGREAIFAH